ncbi:MULTISPECIES: type II CAAX endopeptidase family protein [unclassified Streptococcus]|uniref:CPBP family intramembrane glutamic endopeptidase n=1 Tax=unclassified Streptococcus TaxID=2608887 RepID=UPI0018A98391|nr:MULTISPECIES: type II CAAX endopeptidase family protein [unclassified Streptococcus]MBF8969377.1 CPBP family intramembrane metalloprotease [Streptococcus sp. NLN76]MBG9366782.1 CPBP family intramembrane metalloprotease [Streptococcus sp. NLN64]
MVKILKWLGRILIWFFMIQVVGALNALPMLLGLEGVNYPTSMQWIQVFVYLILIFAVVFGITRWVFRVDPTAPQQADFGREEWKYLFKNWGILLISNLAFQFVRTLIGLNQPVENQQLIVDSVSALQDVGRPYLTATVISLAFIGPVLEEFVFRGLGTRYVFKGWSPGISAILVSMAFGAMHIPDFSSWAVLLDWIFYSWMGYLFHRAMERRNNIWDAVWLHMLNNAIASLAILFLM